MRLFLGKTLIVIGIVLAVLGGLILLSGYIPWLGKLPGDIRIKRDGFSFNFPLTTCIIISILLTLIFRLLGRR